MGSVEYRIKELFPDPNRHVLLLDASAGLSLGVLPGLEQFGQSVPTLLSMVDGVVCSPGQLRRVGKGAPREGFLLARMDWTNTLRDDEFPLPPEKATHLTLLDADGALALGADGMVTTFLLGYEEAVEAGCQKAIVQLALTGKNLGLPLLVEVRVSGPRVSLPGKAVELGASYALESGADVVVVPHPGLDSLTRIATMLSVPWFVKPTSAGTVFAEWEQAAGLGAAGLWLDHSWLLPGMPLKQAADHLHSAPEQAS